MFIVSVMTAGVVLRGIAALIFHVLKTVTEMATVWMGSVTARMAGMERLVMRKLVQIYVVVMEYVRVSIVACAKKIIQEQAARYGSVQITVPAKRTGYVSILPVSVNQTTSVLIVQKQDARKIAQNVGGAWMGSVVVT